jgi:hypothetical protein
MSRARRAADIPAGSWTKWLLAGFWVVVLAVAFPLSKKLTGAEKNDASVAFGIVLDTIIVRSVLVTALNLDLGRWMWWPGKLAPKSGPAPHELGQERTRASAASASRPSVG